MTTKANPLTYPTSRLPFSQDVFQQPPSEYRGAPFWAWNHKQEKKRTVQQLEVMKEMGMGGAHLHVRVGLDLPYMGEEFMDLVKASVAKAKEQDMQLFLYDEDRWPSGFAGGKVLEGHPEHKGLHILFTPWPYGAELPFPKSNIPIANAFALRSELGYLLARFDIHIEDGYLASFRKLADDESATHDLWYAYCEPNGDSGFFGDQTYTDLLSADMTKRFIEVTHDVYKEHCSEDFGTTIPSIFTDEPQYSPIQTLNAAAGKQDIFLPWTNGIEKTFASKTGGADLIARLPEIVWDLGATVPNLLRYQYINHLCDLFSTNYVGVLASWCAKNNLLCTGHMNAEPKLASQTAQNGEVMRCYRDMQLPGIDVLCDSREYNTAKQAASVSRQFGRSGVMSELYGVTGWQFTFEGHKGQGDWQAALGVTLRVHHLFWSSMEGEAKRDYPACIGYQSPWYQEYSHIEDHFARVNSALTRGKAVTRVAVIHPVESYWLCYGPTDKNFEELEIREKAFEDLTNWLLMGHLDFDFISESLFPEQTSLEDIGKKLPVGQCEYDVVVVPNMRTIRSTTLARLEKFVQQGGKVIFAGSIPELVDAQAPSSPVEIKGAETIAWSKARILSTLEPFRDFHMTVSESTLYRTKGKRADSLFYQMREDGDDRFVFITNTDRHNACPVDIAVKGDWKVQVLETLTGKTWEMKTKRHGGKTYFNYYFDGCESTLLHLTDDPASEQVTTQQVLRTTFAQAKDVTLKSISLSEPNALLLDYCQYQFKSEPWQPAEEVLRIDQLMRERLGFFRKGAKFRQPYTIPQEDRVAAGPLKLRFDFISEIDVTGAKLAVESPQKVKITLDGAPISSEAVGWWVDQDIKTVALPRIASGTHTLEIEYQYEALSNLERFYILGDFGVSVHGRTARIVPLNLDRVEWGNIVHQGLPFYTGNLTYHCDLEVTDDQTETALRVARFGGPAVAVDLDGSRAGLLVHEPFSINFGKLPKGDHSVDLTCFGNRYNAFGALHLVPGKTNWLGADSWRSDFEWWSEEYVFGDIGILNAPRVLGPGREMPKQVRRGLAQH